MEADVLPDEVRNEVLESGWVFGVLEEIDKQWVYLAVMCGKGLGNEVLGELES